MRQISRRAMGAVVAVAIAVGGLGATAAAAEAPTRPEYVAALEKMCKPQAKATQRAMDGVRQDVRAGRLALASHKFAQAARIFGATVTAIEKVPRPTADTGRLKTWFMYLNRQEEYLRQISAELRAGHSIKAQRLTARFIHNGNLANNVTLAFGFQWCSFKFSRYG
jgi:hypothetical protein